MSVNRSLKLHAKELVEAQRLLLTGLVQARKDRGMTQGDVAKAMGISQSAVAQFEHYDSNPTLGTIRRYAMAVGADVTFNVKPRRPLPVQQRISKPLKRISKPLIRETKETSVNWDSKTMMVRRELADA